MDERRQGPGGDDSANAEMAEKVGHQVQRQNIGTGALPRHWWILAVINSGAASEPFVVG
jgi:hypothetical protein